MDKNWIKMEAKIAKKLNKIEKKLKDKKLINNLIKKINF